MAAVNGVGRSGYLTGSVTTSALVAPSDLKVSSIKATAATLTWKAPPLLGGTKVLDYVIDLSSGGVNWITITKKASTAESFSLANLRPGTLYQVRLFAIETKGKSEYLLGSFTTVTTLPSVPTKLTASNRSPYSFTLNWIQDSDGGSPITDYVVEVNGGGFNWAKVQKKSSAQTSCMISNLLPGVKYTMRVKAITALGASKVSPTITVSTFTTVPAPPTSLTLKSTNADIAVIAWIAPIDNGGSKIIDYQISFSTDLGQTWAPYARAVSTAAFTNFKGLKPKTTYWLTVSAKNINGISVVSQVLSFTTA
ncbi:MAG: fibronectin type III domain-containing protein [Actinobacteria bacterium]|nr:fibronectin type III domain-containing protein [Actinomycetota bacterium]